MKIESKNLDVHVTAAKYIDSRILCGVGNNLEIYQLDPRDSSIVVDVRIKPILRPGTKIHGIVDLGTELAIFGGKEIEILRKSGLESSVSSIVCKDWILDVCRLKESSSSNLAVLTAHNRVLEYENRDKIAFLKPKERNSAEKCILYSGILIPSGNRSNEMVVAAGTVFREILIWKFNFEIDEENCPILCRLCGHEGVVFSVNFRDGFLCSTSDDRTARVWKVKTWNDIEFKYLLKDIHSARIFRCQIFEDYCVLGGEDGLVSIWNVSSGEFIGTTLQGHDEMSSPIWSLECFKDLSGIIRLVVGSGDGSIRIPRLLPEKFIHVPVKFQNSYPKIVKLYEDDVIVLTEDGRLWRNSKLLNEEFAHKFKSYGLFEIGDHFLFLGNLRGELFIYDLKERNELILMETVHNGSKLFSLIPLLSESGCLDTILTGGDDGELALHRLITDSSSCFRLLTVERYRLPPIAKNGQWWVICGTRIDNDGGLVVGDRNGSLHYFVKGIETAETTLYRIHGKRGVGDLKATSSTVTSIGRDGTIRTFTTHPTFGTEIDTKKIPYDWMDRIMGNLLLGFHSTDFVVYSPIWQRTLIKIPCGGSHRSWDFKQKFKSASFVYIKDKTVFRVVIKNVFHRIDEVCKYGNHYRQINVVNTIYLNDIGPFIITGSEDTLIRIRDRDDPTTTTTATILKSHISSVRSIDCINLDGNTAIVVSGGGRAELKMWKITKCSTFSRKINCSLITSVMLKGDDKRRKKTWRDKSIIIPDAETRITDMIFMSEHRVVAAGSDAVLRLFDDRLRLLDESIKERNCYLKVLKVENDQFLSGSTAGTLILWSILNDSIKIVYRLDNAHMSGINALDIRNRRIVSGGDDGTIRTYRLQRDIIVPEFRVSSAHSGTQVTGIKFLSQDLILSVGVDQRLCGWICDNGLELVERRCSNVADIHGLYVNEKGSEAIVVGEGIQIFGIEL